MEKQEISKNQLKILKLNDILTDLRYSIIKTLESWSKEKQHVLIRLYDFIKDELKEAYEKETDHRID